MDKELTNGKGNLRALRNSIDERTEEEKQTTFLAHFMETHNLKAAVAAAGISYSAVIGWRKFDTAFANAYAEVVQDLCAILETEAYRRAVEGVERPIFQGGEQVGTQMVYSDDLLKLLLKAHLPDKYREKLTVEKNTTTQNTVLVLPQNGREMKIPQGVDVGQFANTERPDMRNYIDSENIEKTEEEE